MRWIWSSDWHEFFGPEPYPFDLAYVEARDGSARECQMLREVIGPPPLTVIDLGCGYGRHIVTLGNEGYRVVGTDISIECTRQAKRRDGTHQVISADNERLPFQDEVFDGAFCVYSSIGYMGSHTQRILDEARRVVHPGGWLVVDVGRYPPGSISWGWERVPQGVAVWCKYTTRRWVHQRNFVASNAVSGQYGLKMQRHTETSLQAGAARAGWVVCGLYGDQKFSLLRASSQRLVMVACRPF